MYLISLNDAQAELDGWDDHSFDCCIEDREYVKWLDPDPEVAAYPRKGDTIVSPYS